MTAAKKSRPRRFTVEQIARTFRVPTRLLIGGVPAKAAHKRKYGR